MRVGDRDRLLSLDRLRAVCAPIQASIAHPDFKGVDIRTTQGIVEGQGAGFTVVIHVNGGSAEKE